MLKKSRVYKKEKPFRDARLFFIIAEGDREDKYFHFFNEINPRIKVQIVPREGGKSAPKFFLERVNKIKDAGDWSESENDELWFICDVDRWERSQIDELNAICQDVQQWNLAISNPCFEVWLHLHAGDMEDKGEACSDLKKSLQDKHLGHFNTHKYCAHIAIAAENARKADKDQNHYFPKRMTTKLYNLASNMLNVLGKNWDD